jgi:glyoxylase-like metal-dependent hydrolase (beta-lactamase superfamily II)
MRVRYLMCLCLALMAASVHASEMRFSLVRTGHSTGSGEFAWRDGGWVEPPAVNHLAVLIEHYGDRLLFGTGLGRQIDAQLNAVLPWREKRYAEVRPVRDQLGDEAAGVTRVILDCARWDHASGLADFADVPVLASPESMRYVVSATPPAVLPAQFAHGVRWQPLRFEQRRFLGFDESLDLFGDGRLILVKLPGHDALGLFITLDDGRRFFFRGDAAGSSAPDSLPEGITSLQNTTLQAQLGFYPRWVE